MPVEKVAFTETLSSSHYFDQFRYNYRNSPDQLSSHDLGWAVIPQFLEINCLSFVHIYLEEECGFYVLPKEEGYYTGHDYYYNCLEFRPVVTGEKLVQGDIFLFGPAHLTDLHKLHLAVFSGEYDELGQPLLWHATNHPQVRTLKPDGGVIRWSLSEFLSLKKYHKLFGVRRIR